MDTLSRTKLPLRLAGSAGVVMVLIFAVDEVVIFASYRTGPAGVVEVHRLSLATRRSTLPEFLGTHLARKMRTKWVRHLSRSATR